MTRAPHRGRGSRSSTRRVESHETVAALCRARATAYADHHAYSFLEAGEEEVERVTYGELDGRSRALAVALQARFPVGERALLVYPPGPDFLVAFLGCLYAGLIAVPVPAPHPARPGKDIARLRSIAGNCHPRVVLCSREILAIAREGGWARETVATDEQDRALADRWTTPRVTADTTCLLQYTSGSTTTPRGVAVSHANLLANLAAIHDSEGNSTGSVSVTWLPHYHDMGLIEGLLLPIYSAIPVYAMSPTSFLQRPLRWLQAISRYRATNSGGPNFAYELCLRKITAEQRRTLDLACWRVAYNGSEPIRSATIERFAEVFSQCGFRSRSVRTVYGLAEATLLVTASARDRKPRVMPVCVDALASDQVALPESDGRTVDAVSCGKPVRGTDVVVIDSTTGRVMPEGRIGEIVVSGPGVADGYWGDGEDTRRVFDLRLGPTPARKFLRTGDLGFMDDGELFITGRIKDLIIVRGRKVYPQDIEETVEGSHDGIRAGAVAAYSVRDRDTERLVVMAELEGYSRHRTRAQAAEAAGRYEDIVARIVEDVTDAHGIAVGDVLLVPMGAISKTSSGKIQRTRCRQSMLDGQVHVIHRWRPGFGVASSTTSRVTAAG